MRCPECGIEVRVKEREKDGTVCLVCRNPKCEKYGQVVKKLK